MYNTHIYAIVCSVCSILRRTCGELARSANICTLYELLLAMVKRKHALAYVAGRLYLASLCPRALTEPKCHAAELSLALSVRLQLGILTTCTFVDKKSRIYFIITIPSARYTGGLQYGLAMLPRQKNDTIHIQQD